MIAWRAYFLHKECKNREWGEIAELSTDVFKLLETLVPSFEWIKIIIYLNLNVNLNLNLKLNFD